MSASHKLCYCFLIDDVETWGHRNRILTSPLKLPGAKGSDKVKFITSMYLPSSKSLPFSFSSIHVLKDERTEEIFSLHRTILVIISPTMIKLSVYWLGDQFMPFCYS